MSEPTTLTLARLIRDSADILLPLNRTDGDTAIRRIDFDLDVDRSDPRGLNGTVVLITEAAANLDRLLESYRGAAALVVAPGAHAHLGDEAINPSTTALPLVLERSAGVTWAETLLHLRQLAEGASTALTWPDVDDLSSLAAVIADSTGASITIEDPASRVLAHANLGDDLDEIRKQTILTGAIPDWRIAQLEESGFLPAVRASTDVVERPATADDPARSVIALRSDGEMLGTIWAAYPAEVDPGTVRDVLREAARAAVPVMLRTLRRSPFDARIRAEALGSILAGTHDLAPAATLLSLPFAGHYTALALNPLPADAEALLRFHLRAAFADVVLARIADRVAVLLQSAEATDEEDVRERIVDTLERTMPTGARLTIGVGASVHRLDHVPASWTEAVYVFDALAALADPDSASFEEGGPEDLPGWSSTSVHAAIAADLPAELVGLEIADALTEADPRIAAPAKILAVHDAAHQGQLVRTLEVYFETVGNSAEASRRLHVHANSLRHRLFRIEELTGLSPMRRADRLWLEVSLLVLDRQRRRPTGSES